ncbi:hypothetical protein SAMN05421690_101063 [Nitrosomonas sp. Nm51]|uniref:hypothetical protein n=1 Tax=Nitrosomonas sp. Nm51 TaxID=133720 RepID=UPI0008CE700D|nr:hypothetical protein [Nitrosomonas sp. Nm51]SER16256.1 hypothetical protein SAMN05421690_101063 [Nitrosomonas sp. Nm51]
MAEDIPIITGDPLGKEGGASFTCFVLPFRYQPTLKFSGPAAEILGKNRACFKEVDKRTPKWVNRMRYFTGETARVLYDHARWFELPDCDWRTFNWGSAANAEKVFRFYCAQSSRIAIKFHPPRLILFEWNDVKKAEPKNTAQDKQRDQDLFDIGFLIIKVSFETNDNQPNYRDVLFLNELFRYWRMPFDKHDGKMRLMFENSFGWRSEDLYLRRWSDLLRIPFQICGDRQMYSLFPDNWNAGAEAWWQSEIATQNRAATKHRNASMDNAGWICYADNRAFVWSCAVVENGANALKKMGHAGNGTPGQLGGWIKFLNVDEPRELDAINSATPFEKKWVKKRYYDRWAHFGTLYGFNYHAGVMLTGPCGEPPIVHHFHNQYLDMTLLLLYLRITLFRFSRELTRLSADMRDTTDYKKAHRAEFKSLRREFAIFTNLYQFPLISNQQQAIEMYALIRQRMDVQELFREVEEEIKSSHEYFQFEEESKLNNSVHFLTIIGAILAFIGVIATFASIPPDAFEYFREYFAEKKQVTWPAIPHTSSPKNP